MKCVLFRLRILRSFISPSNGSTYRPTGIFKVIAAKITFCGHGVHNLYYTYHTYWPLASYLDYEWSWTHPINIVCAKPSRNTRRPPTKAGFDCPVRQYSTDLDHQRNEQWIHCARLFLPYTALSFVLHQKSFLHSAKAFHHVCVKKCLSKNTLKRKNGERKRSIKD